MRKGISTIIATIMLVVITIGLISTAYLYFSTIVTVGPVIAIASGFCDSTQNIKITIRNDGTSDLTMSSVTWLKDGTQITPAPTCGTGTLIAGNSTTCTITGNTAGRLYNILAVGPKNQAGGPVKC